MALQGGADPVTFTLLRVLCAAGVLSLLLWFWYRRQPAKPHLPGTDWIAALALLVYLFGFSLAYLSLDAGLGALVLFGCVQLTMLIPALIKREPQVVQSLPGAAVALFGFVGLAWPGELHIDLVGFLLMALAGAGWGVYSLRGRGRQHPLAITTKSFVAAVPVCIAAFGAALWVGAIDTHVQTDHLLLAVLSGALASGVGYVVWYSVLPELKIGQAATVQLAVPVMAAIGGALLIDEAITTTLVGWGSVVLLGIVWSMFPIHQDKQRR